MTKMIFPILDMHCSNCAMRIESIEDELPGVLSASASYQKGQLVVVYDAWLLTPEAIIAAVKQKGYTAMLPEPRPLPPNLGTDSIGL